MGVILEVLGLIFGGGNLVKPVGFDSSNFVIRFGIFCFYLVKNIIRFGIFRSYGLIFGWLTGFYGILS